MIINISFVALSGPSVAQTPAEMAVPQSEDPLIENLRVCISGKTPRDQGIPPLELKNLLESKPPESRFFVRELTACGRIWSRPVSSVAALARGSVAVRAFDQQLGNCNSYRESYCALLSTQLGIVS